MVRHSQPNFIQLQGDPLVQNYFPGDDLMGPLDDAEGERPENSAMDVDGGGVPASSSSSSSSSSGSSDSSSSSENGEDGARASGSGDAPPLHPPAVADDGGLYAGPGMGRKKCEWEVILTNGTLRFYRREDRVFIAAECARHANCVLTRLCSESKGKAKNREGQGRPVGLLMAWLSSWHLYHSGPEHVHMQPLPSFEDRQACRDVAKKLPGMRYLLENAERPRRPDEGEEPDFVP